MESARVAAVTREFVVQRPNRSPRPEWNILRTEARLLVLFRFSPNARNAPLSPSRQRAARVGPRPLPRLCGAIVGRLTFAGQIIETDTTSYRLAHAHGQRSAKQARQPADCK
jgi:hypothetical protein